ncbi:hypothetical protein P3X46_017340 [Hevea brasiliensis]|uniref:Uncharacterized protein n=1 Tax=Hevea brasiliensis TaxID=3981 RepID=A0ABQ9M359_HEVBR|nr:hypothetical protein P3X46_017340 [Hevea brasiliensis]
MLSQTACVLKELSRLNLDYSESFKNAVEILKRESKIAEQLSSFEKEFKEFKNEIEDAKLRKDMTEAVQMEQIIAFLENADAIKSHEEREKKVYWWNESCTENG